MFNLSITWLSSMAWHMAQILKLKPSFKYISDTSFSLFSFMALFAVTATFRWYFIEGSSARDVFITIFIHIFTFMLMCGYLVGTRKPSSLPSLLFAVSIIVDLLAVTYTLSSGVSSSEFKILSYLEFFGYGFIYFSFLSEPKEVRTVGYRYTP